MSVVGETTDGRDDRGLPLRAEVNVVGILYSPGTLGLGELRVYGEVMAGAGLPGERARIYYDEGLAAAGWPRAGSGIPRTLRLSWRPGG